MDKIKEKLSNPIKDWRRRSSVVDTSGWVGEHDGYDSRPLPRLTRKGFWMGILVSMGGFVFGYEHFSFFAPGACFAPSPPIFHHYVSRN